MAHFYATIHSKKGQTHRCGNKDGLRAVINGWTIGVQVELRHNAFTNTDTLVICENGGSKHGIVNKTLVHMEAPGLQAKEEKRLSKMPVYTRRWSA